MGLGGVYSKDILFLYNLGHQVNDLSRKVSKIVKAFGPWAMVSGPGFKDQIVKID